MAFFIPGIAGATEGFCAKSPAATGIAETFILVNLGVFDFFAKCSFAAALVQLAWSPENHNSGAFHIEHSTELGDGLLNLHGIVNAKGNVKGFAYTFYPDRFNGRAMDVEFGAGIRLVPGHSGNAVVQYDKEDITLIHTRV